MPCQCGTRGAAASESETALIGCQCGTESASACECGTSAVSQADRELRLERVVMELDQRLRKLEGGE